MSTITFTLGADGIAQLSIDITGRPLNVYTPEFAADLSAAIERVASDEAVRGAILTSGKSTGFMAGADLRELVTLYDQGITPRQGADWAAAASALYRRIETCGKPVVAAINGLALGGGYELCLACHHRILVDDRKAVVGLPEVTVGLLPGAGGTQRLARMIGIEAALPLLLQGSRLGPADALKAGLVDAVVPADQVIERARGWLLNSPVVDKPWDRKGFKVPGGAGPLAPFASRSFQTGTSLIKAQTQQNNLAPLAILSAVYEGTQVPFDTGLRIEAKYFGTLLASPVARNLMRTLFINKMAADKLERRPAGVAKSVVMRLGIIGAGMMGAGIAQAAASVGIDVVLIDRDEAAANRGRDIIRRTLERDLERGRTTREAVDATLARIVPTVDYSQLAGADLVVEAVIESRAVKAGVTAAVEAVIAPDTVLASNTSTLSITSLAGQVKQSDRFIGIHFFSPAERMPLVEVIVGQATSQETIARALDLVAQLRKTPIVVNDSPGFFTSRIFCTYIDEGMAMLAEGVAPALIENAARMIGMATGPLAVTDEVSLDLQKLVIDQAEADGLPDKFLRAHARPVVTLLNGLGRLGRKSGGGFYDFPQGGRKRLWSGLAGHFPVKAEQPAVEDVKNRLLYIQALESARCIEEGVITNPADADVGAILGLGFPSWAGGPLSFIDTVGIKAFVAECQRLAALHGARFQPSGWLIKRAERAEPFYPAAS